MSLVTKTLLNALIENMQKHHTLVWYDPEQDYLSFMENLSAADIGAAAVLLYQPDRGFIWLRHEIEPYWQNENPPSLLIYVPLNRRETHHALVEYETAGAILQPGMQPPEQNTSLAVIAQRALSQLFPPAAVAKTVSQVEADKLTLAELDELTEKGVEGQAGVINAIFDSGNANEVALHFLSDPSLDEEITSRQALDSIVSLMSDALGVSFDNVAEPATLRMQMASLVLSTDLIVALGPDTPSVLETVVLAERDVARDTAVSLAKSWRNRVDLQESYVQWAKKVQAELGLAGLDISLSALARAQTFSTTEIALQVKVEEQLTSYPTKKLVALAQKRIKEFWSSQDPIIKMRWEIIRDAGHVLREAERINSALKKGKWTAEALLAQYAFGEANSDPWCMLDASQRHLERDYHRFDVNHSQHDSLVKLVVAARHQYADAVAELANIFTRVYEKQQFELPQVLLQADIFNQTVAPAIKSGEAAYILVDALRFEMARELNEQMGNQWESQLDVALATPPTITEIGMAALLPGAEKGVSFVEASGKVVPVIDGQKLKNRAERIELFRKSFSGKKVVETKLDQLAPLANNQLSKKLSEAEIVLVTATEEIDGLCESNPNLARRMLDDVFNQLRRGISTLFDLGVKSVVVTADHGYLFGEEISSGESIDAPGGHTAILKRRVWVGKGGAEIPGTLRQPLAAFGINSELELVSPNNLSCFKVPGGGMSYFHGGLSLQEIAIPVLTIKAAERPSAMPESKIVWGLETGTKAISNRFVTVNIVGETKELLPLQPPSVRVEVRINQKPVSVPVGATYGFQESTKDVQLQTELDNPRKIRPNTVTLHITEEISEGTATVHLLNATNGRTLKTKKDVPVTLMY